MNKIQESIILCFILSWGLVAISKYNGLEYQSNNGFFLAIAYMFMPALSVILLSKLVWKERLTKWGIRKPKKFKLFAIAWVLPIIITIISILLSLLLGSQYVPIIEGVIKTISLASPDHVATTKEQLEAIGSFLPFLIIAQALIAGITVNALAALGEEYLWRGLLLKEMKNKGWIKASLFIGFIWGLWHAPLILQGHNYPNEPYLGVLMMIVWCMAFSPIMTYFTLHTRSVFTAAVIHGTINAIAGISLICLSGGNELLIGITGIAGIFSLIIINIIIIVSDNNKKKTDELFKEY